MTTLQTFAFQTASYATVFLNEDYSPWEIVQIYNEVTSNHHSMMGNWNVPVTAGEIKKVLTSIIND